MPRHGLVVPAEKLGLKPPVAQFWSTAKEPVVFTVRPDQDVRVLV